MTDFPPVVFDHPAGLPAVAECLSFGYLHAPAPADAHLVINLADLLRNPHDDPAFRELTGLDPVVHDHVLDTDGALDIVEGVLPVVRRIITLNKAPGRITRVAFGCRGGKHRSVTLTAHLAACLNSLGHGTRVVHRDVLRPVAQSTR